MLLWDMEKMTIHRALAELKVIGDRIQKGIDSVVPTGFQMKDKLVNNTTPRADFEAAATSSFQSVTDLIERRTKIKSAIVQSNAFTKVNVGGKEMTVAEAINNKAVIDFKSTLVTSLRKKAAQLNATIEQHNSKVDEKAIQLATAALQKQNVKIGDDDVQKVIGPFTEANRAVLVDPLGIDKKIQELEKDIVDFKTEVDAVLSESNAVTFIEF